MIIRFVKILFGIGFALSLCAEYNEIVKQVGGDIFTLSFVCVVGALSLFVAYTGIKSVSLRAYLKNKTKHK